MLRPLSRAMLVTAILAAPAGAQFGGPSLGANSFTMPNAQGQVQLGNGATASTGLTQIDDQIGANVVVASPEPAEMTLVATGLLGIFGVVRRKRQASHR
jgi:microcystin-dependent protein